MKTILIFVGLKTAEIIGILVVLWLLSVIGFFIMDIFDITHGEGWIFSRVGAILHAALAILLPVLIFIGVFKWFDANWEKAKQLGGKF